jgi:hypothetical protein
VVLWYLVMYVIPLFLVQGLLLFPDLDALEEHLKQLQQQEQELQSQVCSMIAVASDQRTRVFLAQFTDSQSCLILLQVQQGTSQSQSRRVGTQSSSSHQVPPQPLPSQQVSLTRVVAT